MDYKVAQAHNNTGGLQDWNVPKPPRCEGLRAGRRLTAGNTLTYQDGKPSTILEFSYHDADEKAAVESQLGLSSDTGVVSGFFTVTLPKNNDRDFGNFNVTLTLPPELESTSFDRGKWLSYGIIVSAIEEIV